MQAAIDRCKSTVTGILKSAGEARGDAPIVTTVNAFLGEIAKEWHDATPSANLNYENTFGADVPPIVADSTLKQLVFNLLDNAFEASPRLDPIDSRTRGRHPLVRGAGSWPGSSRKTSSSTWERLINRRRAAAAVPVYSWW